MAAEAHRKLDEMLANHCRRGVHGLQVLCITTVDGTAQRVGTGLWMSPKDQKFMVA